MISFGTEWYIQNSSTQSLSQAKYPIAFFFEIQEKERPEIDHSEVSLQCLHEQGFHTLTLTVQQLVIFG
jgi:hypothetical protein